MSKTSIKNNLRVGLGLSLLILFVTSLASFVSIRNLIKNSELVAHSNAVLSNLDEVLSTLKDAETGQRGYLLTGEKEFLEPYNGARQASLELLNEIHVQTKDNAFQQSNAKKLEEIIQGRMGVLQNTIVIKGRGGNVSIAELRNGKSYMDAARILIKTMKTEELRLLDERTRTMNTLAGYTPILILLAAFLAIVITLSFYRRVNSDFNKRTQLQLELQEKNEEIDNRIEIIQGVAGKISSGDYQVRMDETVKDGLGSLSLSLNAMAESLQYSFTMLADKEWLQSGIANLNNKMVGEKDVPELAGDILESIVEHVNSQVAAFYLVEGEDRLLLIGRYALAEDRKKGLLKFGEGLAGQAVLSGKQMLINDIPEGELTISYAVGNTKPRNVVAVPVLRDDIVVGVMEFGSLQSYTPVQLDFLNSISNNIGLAIHVAQNRKKLQEFLEETQAQAEELQAQHRELEGLNAELEAQTQRIQNLRRRVTCAAGRIVTKQSGTRRTYEFTGREKSVDTGA